MNVGANVDKYESLLSSLTLEQLVSMFAIEGKDSTSTIVDDTIGVNTFTVVDDDASLLLHPTTTIFKDSIPGLTDQQIRELTELEVFIRTAKKKK
mmetsp:Transcript_17431/g.17537  ORF Transcript_17431/g.17537 Transcript_17431/m.17537 type:complete len:95 (-) Transcript_17431:44-328(-)